MAAGEYMLTEDTSANLTEDTSANLDKPTMNPFRHKNSDVPPKVSVEASRNLLCSVLRLRGGNNYVHNNNNNNVDNNNYVNKNVNNHNNNNVPDRMWVFTGVWMSSTSSSVNEIP